MFETGSDEYKAYRFEKKFESWGGVPFRDLNEEVQKPILAQSSLADGEIPVFGGTAPLGWILVTTRRVIWKADAVVTALPLAEIRNMGWSAGPKASETRLDPSVVEMHWIDENNEKTLTKGRSPWFFLFDVQGIRHEIYLQPCDVVDIWNKILFLRGLEKSYPTN